MLAFLPGSVMAHHSFLASFEGAKTITLEGVVTKVEWANPHMYFYLSVRNEEGKAVSWICEAAGPYLLTRYGWARDLLKAGDRVTVIGHPARGGAPVASAGEVVLPDGRRLPGGAGDDGGLQP